MSENSSFNHHLSEDSSEERLYLSGSTCDTFIVRLYGKLHFKKKLKAEYKDMPQYATAFQKEFEVGFLLQHPALPRYVRLSYEDGVPCIYEEYIEGETLTEFCQSHPGYFRNRHAADLFIDELLPVMAYLHDHQVLFLDLKPDNVMITSVGNHLRLVDLGGCHTDTFTDTEAHTKGFSAPEASFDERTDVYLIGKLMQYAQVSCIYNKVVAKCLDDEPSKRFQSVRELQSAIVRARRIPLLLVMFAVVLACALLCVALVLVPKEETPSVTRQSIVTSAKVPQKVQNLDVSTYKDSPSKAITEKPQREIGFSETRQMTQELHREMDRAFNKYLGRMSNDSTVDAVTFSNTINPYNAALKDIEKRMVEKYPSVPPSTIHYEIEKYISETVSPLMQRVLR